MGEVKQSGVKRSEKEYAAQPHYMGLNLFPDMFKASGIVINEDVIHSFITLLTQLSLDYISIS
jgi:hypothetical protein